MLLILCSSILVVLSIFLYGENKLRNTAVPAQTEVGEKNSASTGENVNSAIGISELNRPFQPPLDRAAERVTKKPFGIYITSQNSPVQPEKFQGYHTGTDFEIFPEELNVDVSVKAICDGELALKKWASGYGGILVESCELNGELITVVYGHLKLASIAKKAGDALAKGEGIGILGKAYSAETDGERKHLHLGVHKGSGIDIRGYVQNQSELLGWLDPCNLQSVCQ